jgi:hypothetical protein
LAYHSYHSAKKDFEADQAWLHYAGAMEMAALSVFLQNGHNRTIPFHYFDKALTTYLQTCKSVLIIRVMPFSQTLVHVSHLQDAVLGHALCRVGIRVP